MLELKFNIKTDMLDLPARETVGGRAKYWKKFIWKKKLLTFSENKGS